MQTPYMASIVYSDIRNPITPYEEICPLFLREETKDSLIRKEQIISLCVEPGFAPRLPLPEILRPRNGLDARRNI